MSVPVLVICALVVIGSTTTISGEIISTESDVWESARDNFLKFYEDYVAVTVHIGHVSTKEDISTGTDVKEALNDMNESSIGILQDVKLEIMGMSLTPPSWKKYAKLLRFIIMKGRNDIQNNIKKLTQYTQNEIKTVLDTLLQKLGSMVLKIYQCFKQLDVVKKNEKEQDAE